MNLINPFIKKEKSRSLCLLLAGILNSVISETVCEVDLLLNPCRMPRQFLQSVKLAFGAFLSLIALLSHVVYGLKIVGHASFPEQWVPVAHYTYDFGDGIVGRLKGRLKSDLEGVYFVVYDDEANSWLAVKENETAVCAWKKRTRTNGGPAKSSTLIHSGVVDASNGKGDSAKYSTIVDVDIYEKLRPRTWHFAFVRCAPGGWAELTLISSCQIRPWGGWSSFPKTSSC